MPWVPSGTRWNVPFRHLYIESDIPVVYTTPVVLENPPISYALFLTCRSCNKINKGLLTVSAKRRQSGVARGHKVFLRNPIKHKITFREVDELSHYTLTR